MEVIITMDENKEVKELQSEDLENVVGGMRIPFEKHFDPSILITDERYPNPSSEDKVKDATAPRG